MSLLLLAREREWAIADAGNSGICWRAGSRLYQLRDFGNLLFERQTKLLNFLLSDSPFGVQSVDELIVRIGQHRDDEAQNAAEICLIHSCESSARDAAVLGTKGEVRECRWTQARSSNGWCLER